MDQPQEAYGLNPHCTSLLQEYKRELPVFEKLRCIVDDVLHKVIKENGLYVTAIESRVKAETSFAKKLAIKGEQYARLRDVPDIVGARVVAFFNEDVDKVAAIAARAFDVDRSNSIDKRKISDCDRFGYSSLHIICRIPRSVYYDPATPELNEIQIELQLKTALQHVWATIYHDTGYKTDVEIPKEYQRSFIRLASMVEMMDAEFSELRMKINEYRHEVQALVSDGQFSKLPLDADTFASYLRLGPFDELTRRIAAINQADIFKADILAHIDTLADIGFTTIGDIDNLIKDYSEYAYELAVYELATTDLDIISSTLALQDLLIAYIYINGGDSDQIAAMLDSLGGYSEGNKARAEHLMDLCEDLQFSRGR